MSDTKRRTTNDEIEALLRDEAGGEIDPSGGRVARGVASRLRSDPELRVRAGGSSLRALLDDEGHVPRWFLAAAAIAVVALVGWLLIPAGPASRAPEAPRVADAPTLPDPSLFKAAPRRLLAMALEPQNELRHEAKALVGAGWELAGRVINGIPIELVKATSKARDAG